MAPETYTAYYQDPATGQTGTTEVPVGQAPPPGYTVVPGPNPSVAQPGDATYSLVNDPNWHPEYAENLAGKMVDLPDGSKISLAQWVSMTIAEQDAMRSGNPLPAGSTQGLQKLDNGEYVTKYDYNKLPKADQDYLKANGIGAFNQHKEEQVNQAVEASTVLLDNGERVDKEFYNKVPTKIDDFVSEYDNPQQLLKTKGIDAFNKWANEYQSDLKYNAAAAAGANLNLYSRLAKVNPQAAEAYSRMAQTQRIATSGLGIIKQAKFLADNIQVGPLDNNEWMNSDDYNSLPDGTKELINRIGLSSFQEQLEEYEKALKPYWVSESPTRVGADENFYDLSKITYQEAQDPQIRNAVAAFFPGMNLDQLGKTPIDSKVYNLLKNNPDSKITKAMINKSGISVDELYPIEEITPTQYMAKKESLANVGKTPEEIAQIMSNYYMATGDIEEYKEYAKNQNLDVTFEPSAWQQMTPWKEELGQTVTFKGGSVMAMEYLVPGFFVGTSWNKLSNAERAFYIILDILSLAPSVKTVGVAARAVETSSMAARVSAVTRSLLRETLSQVEAPITMALHPVGTIKGTYRTIADVFEDILSPSKIPNVTLTTSDSIVRLAAKQTKNPQIAAAFRDKLTELIAIKHEKPIVSILDENGNGWRVELGVSPVMKQAGGMAHATPDLRPFMREVTTTTKVKTSSLLEAFNEVKGLYDQAGIASKIKMGRQLSAAEQDIIENYRVLENGVMRLSPDQASLLPSELYRQWIDLRVNPKVDSSPFKIKALGQAHESLLYKGDFSGAAEIRSRIRNMDISEANKAEARAAKFEIREKGREIAYKEGMPKDEQGWFLSNEPAIVFTKGSAFGREVVPMPSKVYEGAKVSKAKISRHMEKVAEYPPAEITRLDKKAIRALDFSDAKSLQNLPKELVKKIQGYYKANHARIYGSMNEWLKLKKAARPNDIDGAFENQAKAIHDLREMFEDAGYQTKPIPHAFEFLDNGEWVKFGDIADKTEHSALSIKGMSRPGNVIDGIEIETIGEQYLRQTVAAASKDHKSALRAARVRKAARDISKMIQESGMERRQPGILIVSPDTAAHTISSGKTFWTKNVNSVIDEIVGNKVRTKALEMERVLPTGEKGPRIQQELYTRIGPDRRKIMIGLEKPLSRADIEIIRNKRLVETIKAPFKRPISVTKIGRGLMPDDLKELGNVLRDSNNRIAAENLQKWINDNVATRNIVTSARGSSRTISLLAGKEIRASAKRGSAGLSSNRGKISISRPKTGNLQHQANLASAARKGISERQALSASAARKSPLERQAPPTRKTTADYQAPPTRKSPPGRQAPPTRKSPPGRQAPPTRKSPLERQAPPTRKSPPGRQAPPTRKSPPGRQAPPRRVPPVLNPPKKETPPTFVPGEELSKISKKDLSASVAWNQGRLMRSGKLVDQYIIVHPPYGPNDKVYTTKVPALVPIVDGPGSAYDTLRKITGGNLPPSIKVDIGAFDAKITSNKETPKLEFSPDRFPQDSRGLTRGRIIQKAPRTGIARVKTSR